MKKKLFVVCLALSMLALFTGTVFAEPSAAGTVIELVRAQGGASGTVFIFKVSGEFSGADLKGVARVGDGGEFTLHCNQLDSETVRCLTSSKAEGDVTVTFGGSTFRTHIRSFTPKYCYAAWDWWQTGTWENYGPICQTQPAQFLDLSYYSYAGTDWWVEFYDVDVSNACFPDPVPYGGPAYYFPACPFP